MSEFSDLATIISKRRTSAGRLFVDWEVNADNKEGRLLNLVLERPHDSDKQLAKVLYGSSSQATMVALRQLRTRVQERLLNQLGFLDYSNERGLKSRGYERECRNLLYRASVLWSEGEIKLCVRLAYRCYKQAHVGDFTSYAEQATTLLMNCHMILGNLPKYEQLAELVDELRHKLSLERQAERILHLIRLRVLRTTFKRRAYLNEIPQLLTQLDELHQRVNSYTTFDSLYRANVIYAETAGDWERAYKYTQQAAELVATNQLNERRFDVRYVYYTSILFHLKSRRIEEGLALAEPYSHAFQPTSSNWFLFYETYVLLAFHARQYELAAHLWGQVERNSSFAKLPAHNQEQWLLISVYVALLQPSSVTGRRLVVTKFMTPMMSKDLGGTKTFLLIYPVLYNLQQGNREEATASIETLRNQPRILRDDQLLRARTFLSLLLLLPEHDFSPTRLACSDEVRRGLETLLTTEQTIDSTLLLEIIPFYNLWEFIMATLAARPLR